MELFKMPLHEYKCDDCQRRNTVLVYSWSKEVDRACQHCSSTRLTKLISGFAVRRSWGDSLGWIPSGETLRDVNEDDPRSIDRFMGRIKDEMGGQVTPDFNDMRRELSPKPDSSDDGHHH